MAQQQRRVLVGVGGGIAAYKVCTLVSRLVQQGDQVQVALSAGGARFVGEATWNALSGRPVASDTWQQDRWPLGPHIECGNWASLFVVAPATADLLSEFAQGSGRSLLSLLYLHVGCPVLVAPAMSYSMWSKPAVQRNVQQLEADGVHVVGPAEGWLSCRTRGVGRMAEPEAILEAIGSL